MRFGIKTAYHEPIGSYEFSDLPGCSQVCVSHSLFVKQAHRGKALSKPLMNDRISKAKELCYDLMICTVDASNIAQVKTLEEFGWVVATSFVSSKTGHIVHLYTKAI